MSPHRNAPRPKLGAVRTVPMEEGSRLAEIAQNAVRQRFRPALVVLSGNSVGERASLHGNAPLGRDPDGALVLTDPGVSWRHALVEDRGDHYAVVDLDSTNGTFVNGVRKGEAKLSPGDKIRLGTTTLRFEIQDEHDAAFTEAIAQLVNVDDLTGLYPRRRFDAELEGLVSASKASGAELGLLAMDLDGIKAINDRHGHLFGAYTISTSGKLIGEVIRPPAIACRFGGDEFIAALPGHGLEASVEVAHRIHAHIAAHPFEHEGERLRPGVSIGVAVFPAHADDARSLFQAADEALYDAKRRGKNQVRTRQAR